MRLIDADVLVKRIQYLLLLGHRDAFDCLDEIDAAPTIDAVEVVRCKNCKFCTETYDNGDCWCSHDEHLQWFKVDHFCGYGERKNDATD